MGPRKSQAFRNWSECTILYWVVSIYPIIIAYIQNMNSMKMCVLELSEIRDRKAQEERWSSLPFWKQIEQCPRKSQD